MNNKPMVDASTGTSGIRPWQAPTPALALEESWEDNRLPQWPPDWPFRSGGMGVGAAEEMVRILAGEPPRNFVNPASRDVRARIAS